MIIIAQYQGIGCCSKAIRFQTGGSLWSHTAIVLRDNSVVEAWCKGGVSHLDSPHLIYNLSLNHTRGTVVDLFRIKATKEQADIFEAFILSQVGKGYDFRSVFRFLTRSEASKNDKWFCSELSFFGLQKAGINILERIPAAKVSPQLHGISPFMKPIGSIIAGVDYDTDILCH